MGHHSLLLCRGRGDLLHHCPDHRPNMGETDLECLVDMGSQVDDNPYPLVHLCRLSHVQGCGG